MIISKVTGGLGNQLFQYAIGYTLAKDRKTKLYLDINDFKNYKLRSFKLDQFNVDYSKMTSIHKAVVILSNKTQLVSKYFPILPKTIKEKDRIPDFENIHGSLYLIGFWQNPNYFEKYKKDLLIQFTLKDELSNEYLKLKSEMNKGESVAIHIRRGDYANNKHTLSVHGLMPLSYYKSAVKKIKTSSKKHKYFIFSDDPKWVKSNFTFINNYHLVSEKINSDLEELFLISECKHQIIANSTFSWWGAWLNQYPKKQVIAPKNWMKAKKNIIKYIYPKDWQVI